MKCLFLTCIQFFLWTFCFSQDLLFKQVSQNDSLKIICLTDHFDSLQSYKRFTFFCRTKDDVGEVLKSFKVGRKTKEQGEEYGLNIYILKGKEIQPIQIVINPSYNNVNTDALGEFEYYSFDTSQLLKAHNKYPVDFYAKWLTFDTKKEFDNFLETYSNDTTFLCYEDNTLEHSGIGIIKIKRDQTIKDGFIGVSYIEKILKRLSPTGDDYLVGFTPANSTSETFAFTVQCSKELFDKIKDDRCKKGKWELNTFELLTYWTK